MYQKNFLKNNISYYLYPTSECRKEITIELLVNVGSNQDDLIPGTAHFLEHMLLGFDRSGEDEKCCYDSIYGKTGFNLTSYKIKIASNDIKIVTGALEILRDILLGKTLIEDMYGMVFSDICLEFDRYFLNNTDIKLLEGISIDQCRFPIGNQKKLYKLDFNLVKQFWNLWYIESPVALVAAGDFNVNNMEEEIKKIFGPLNMHKLYFHKKENIINAKELYMWNNGKNIIELLIKKDLKFSSLRDRGEEDLVFSIIEVILKDHFFRRGELPFHVFFQRVRYDAERQYVKLHISSTKEDAEWEEILKKGEFNVLTDDLFENIINEKTFEYFKKEYVKLVNNTGQLTVEEFITEATNNFLYNDAIYNKNDYIREIENIKFNDIRILLLNLIKNIETLFFRG